MLALCWPCAGPALVGAGLEWSPLAGGGCTGMQYAEPKVQCGVGDMDAALLAAHREYCGSGGAGEEG